MQTYITLCLISFLFSIICGFILIPFILKLCKEKGLYDLPDSRKVHKNAIPRLGGTSFFPSMFASSTIAIFAWYIGFNGYNVKLNLWTALFILGLTITYITGLLDDIKGLKASTKFFIQIFVASLLPISNLYINNLYGFLGIYQIPTLVGMPFTVFVIVFIMNAINLIDGIDGLSTTLSLIALAGFLFYFANAQLFVYCIIISGLIGVLLVYLYYNIFGKEENNSKIFMGDSGSLTIGYILGVLLVKFCMETTEAMPYREESIIISLSLILIPIFDVCRIIVARLKHGKSIFSPDKNHIHHKVLRTGLNQHQALFAIVTTAILFIIFNLLIFPLVGSTITIIADISVYLFINYFILNYFIKRNNRDIFSKD